MLGYLSAAAPPVQPLPRTDWQRRRFEEVSDAARLASEQALPELLAELDGSRFRARLAEQCAPLAANSSASDLLRRLRAEYSVAEVVSSFDAESPSGGPFKKASWWSFTLADGMAGDELLNQWEVRVKHGDPFNGGKGWFTIQDDVETKLYGLRPFSSHASPRSDAEAAERGMCAARIPRPRTRLARTTSPFFCSDEPGCPRSHDTYLLVHPWQICAAQPRGRKRRQSAVWRHLRRFP